MVETSTTRKRPSPQSGREELADVERQHDALLAESKNLSGDALTTALADLNKLSLRQAALQAAHDPIVTTEYGARAPIDDAAAGITPPAPEPRGRTDFDEPHGGRRSRRERSPRAASPKTTPNEIRRHRAPTIYVWDSAHVPPCTVFPRGKRMCNRCKFGSPLYCIFVRRNTHGSWLNRVERTEAYEDLLRPGPF